jgi:hypothetical protein
MRVVGHTVLAPCCGVAIVLLVAGRSPQHSTWHGRPGTLLSGRSSNSADALRLGAEATFERRPPHEAGRRVPGLRL